MKTKIALFFISLMTLSVCSNNSAGKTEGEADFSHVIEMLDTMASQLVSVHLQPGGRLDSDSVVAWCWKSALENMRKKYGELSGEMAACYLHVGDELIDVSYPFSAASELAYQCYQNALKVNKAVYGAGSVEVGNNYSDLVYASGRNSSSAKAYADSALAILTPSCGEFSPEVAQVYWNLGESYIESNHDIYRVEAQVMMLNDSEYYTDEGYKSIIANLEQALVCLRKAHAILSRDRKENEEDLKSLEELIKSTEEDVQDNKRDLEHVTGKSSNN